jgi:type II secretory pathway pseudopilin PulG
LKKTVATSSSPDLAPLNNWSTAFTIIENIVGVVIITLFALSINRKLKRTKD